MWLIPIVDVLKDHELYCYQIAYYLLDQEESAVLATKQALIELGQCECFLSENKVERRNRAMKVTARCSVMLATLGR